MTENDERVTKRRGEFARSDTLEAFLGKLNDDLSRAEKQALGRYRDSQPTFPSVFVMGPPRCGSTLFMQWLASTGAFAYPTNMLSRFWDAPIVGARIQKLLTDPAYDFRDELSDFKLHTGFESHHGKTTGALAPNEFWYFWRRFFRGNEYQPQEELERTVDTKTMRAEIAGMTDVLGKPWATKGMIFNENIPFMATALPNAIFVWLRREPEYNIQSLLLARERQYGDRNTWYSFKICDYPKLVDLPPLESVAGQVAAIHQSIELGLEELPEERKLVVDYEQFCKNPAGVYEALVSRLAESGVSLDKYEDTIQFKPSRKWRLKDIAYEKVSAIYEDCMGQH